MNLPMIKEGFPDIQVVRRTSFPAALCILAMTTIASSSLDGGTTRGRQQPIAFNHKIHTQDLGLECVSCHRHVESAEVAGRPSLAICQECHEGGMTESPEEKRLLEYVASGSEIPWIRLTLMPDHVYFSHRRHVVVAGIGCAVCHGEMETRTTPPGGPLKQIDMDFCMDCHERKGASLDCNACHR